LAILSTAWLLVNDFTHISTTSIILHNNYWDNMFVHTSSWLNSALAGGVIATFVLKYLHMAKRHASLATTTISLHYSWIESRV